MMAMSMMAMAMERQMEMATMAATMDMVKLMMGDIAMMTVATTDMAMRCCR